MVRQKDALREGDSQPTFLPLPQEPQAIQGSENYANWLNAWKIHSSYIVISNPRLCPKPRTSQPAKLHHFLSPSPLSSLPPFRSQVWASWSWNISSDFTDSLESAGNSLLRLFLAIQPSTVTPRFSIDFHFSLLQLLSPHQLLLDLSSPEPDQYADSFLGIFS